MERIIKRVKEIFQNEFSGHDYFHTLRVYEMAKRIAEKEDANIEVVILASLLHDVDDFKLSPNTYENKDNARFILKENNIPSDLIEVVCKIIDQVSFKGIDSVIPDTIEGKIVQDADRLDAIGAIGIARAFAYGGNHNRVMYNPEELPKLNMNEIEYRNHVSTTINHFYEKLFTLKDLMNTKTAKNIAETREKYMKEYIDRFIDEWNGIK